MGFPVIDIPVASPVGDEPMGTKRKFWLKHDDGRRWLFKYARVNQAVVTGEDWAEKIAAELGTLLGLPIAHVELATCGGERGMVSFDFTCRFGLPVMPGSEDKPGWHRMGELVHGNELLVERVDQAYPAARTYRVSEHTVNRVLSALADPAILPALDAEERSGIDLAADMFTGYLLLDAWIGNTDRHHENWAVIDLFAKMGGSRRMMYLAPSYDHASSLGRYMSDEQFTERFTTRDRNRTVAAYVDRARSALFEHPGDSRPLSPLGAFEAAAHVRPEAARYWRERLAGVGREGWRRIVDAVPAEIMSDPARDFVDRMLGETQHRLLT